PSTPLHPLSLHGAPPLGRSTPWPWGSARSYVSPSRCSEPSWTATPDCCLASGESRANGMHCKPTSWGGPPRTLRATSSATSIGRSEEHTSELQSRENLVC